MKELSSRQFKKLVSEASKGVNETLVRVTDVDNGQEYPINVLSMPVPAGRETEVRIKFGNSFSVTIDRFDWDALHSAVDEAFEEETTA